MYSDLPTKHPGPRPRRPQKEKLTYLDLERAINNAAALLDVLSEKAADNYEQGMQEHGDEFAAGITALAYKTSRELIVAFNGVYEEFCRNKK